MKFLELVLQNFGPYAGKQIIKLTPEEPEQNSSIILFGGMNGGGKTTLMDAIRLALYGQRAQCSTRGNLSYSEFLLQCINRQANPVDKTRIELLFEHIDYNRVVRLRVVRTWFSPLKEGKDQLGIVNVQEDIVDKALAETWDEYVETLLPLGISNLFLFDGEQVKELADLDTPPPLVTQAIQSLLGLELVERLAVDLDILVNRKRKELANTKQVADLDEIDRRLKEHNAEKEAIIQETASLESQIARAKKKYQEAFDKFLSEGGKIAAERSQLDQDLSQAKENAQNQRQELCELAAGSLPLALIQPILQQVEAQGERETQWQQSQIAKGVIAERDRHLLTYLSTLSLTPDQIQQIETFLASQTLQNDNLNQPWLNIDTETLKQLSVLLNYDISQQIQQGQTQLKKLTEFEQEISDKERQLAAAASPEIYEQLQQAVKHAHAELLRLQSQKESCDRKLREAENAILKAKKDLTEYGEKHIDRSNASHLIKSSVRVQNTLQIFKERLTLKKLNKLEIQVTECFRYLLHKSNLVHRVAIDTQNFSLSLYDPEGKLVPKHRLSAGEKQLLAIAFLWGLARVSGRDLPVAIDTPLGRLDSSHRSNLVERYFPSASQQVILLSTDTEIGKTEVESLRKQNAIAQEYLLKHDSEQRQTTIEKGYFY